ncbi:hypothetical protein KPH14_003005 [Odynerus spinipes]|uniref:Uncharacterized protein n=1 Tax=Odynerus spinipes TaxID=1348599 RepID=A0AAD9RX67_9HYME|nr:hypothetical protein KPH14_003005 [Odynerus spinipes]
MFRASNIVGQKGRQEEEEEEEEEGELYEDAGHFSVIDRNGGSNRTNSQGTFLAVVSTMLNNGERTRLFPTVPNYSLTRRHATR